MIMGEKGREGKESGVKKNVNAFIAIEIFIIFRYL